MTFDDPGIYYGSARAGSGAAMAELPASGAGSPFSGGGEVAPDGRWLMADGRACAILGCGRSELLGRTLESVVHPEDRPSVAKALELLARREIARHRAEIRFLRGDHSFLWADLLIEPVPQDRECLSVALLDITDRKLLEEAMQRRGDRLVRLASLLGHDLRSVLNVMSLHAQLAKASLREADMRAQTSLDTIVTTAQDAAAFMTQLQEYAAALTHHADLDRVSLQHIVAQTLAMLETRLRTEAVVVEVGELPRVLSKEAILARLLHCVVENRLRYCASTEPRIEIAAVSSATRRGVAGLVIRDNGSGISKPEQERAFDALFRASQNSERPGAGLGAAFCREYVEDIGGAMWLECWPGQGGQVVILLPGG